MRGMIVATLVGALCLPGCGRAQKDIAVVDIESIFKEYKKSRLVHEGLEKDRLDMETRGQGMLDEINKLVKESEILSDEARKERESRIREKSIALESYRRAATKSLLDKTNEESQKLLAEVRAAAAAVSVRRGARLVLDNTAVVYGAKGLDITGDVTAELNRSYDKEKKGKKN